MRCLMFQAADGKGLEYFQPGCSQCQQVGLELHQTRLNNMHHIQIISIEIHCVSLVVATANLGYRGSLIKAVTVLANSSVGTEKPDVESEYQQERHEYGNGH